MGTISINPDADGDLHDASLHNDKFQTILNEINGNLDANNLANPNSFLTFTSNAGRSYTGAIPGGAHAVFYPWTGWSPTATVTDPTTQMSTALPWVPISGANECNIIVNSQAYNTSGQIIALVSAGAIYRQTPGYNNANVTLRLQRSATTSVAGAWEDMATMVFNPFAAAAANNSVSAFASTSNMTVANGHYFRALVQNNAGTALSGTELAVAAISLTMTFKVAHTN
tara:strand:+ start:10205 stop:10885 length:681 start_codon:yes stop_codon:yes gene_type:complete